MRGARRPQDRPPSPARSPPASAPGAVRTSIRGGGPDRLVRLGVDPGVALISTRPTPASAARSTSSSASSTTSATPASAAARSSSSLLLLPWTTIRSGDTPARRANEARPGSRRPRPALRRRKAQQRDVLKGLDAVEDPGFGRRFPVGANLVEDRPLAVDDERRAELLRERGGADPADAELTVVDGRGGRRRSVSPVCTSRRRRRRPEACRESARAREARRSRSALRTERGPRRRGRRPPPRAWRGRRR